MYLHTKNAIGIQTLNAFGLTEFESSSGLFLFALFFENEKGRWKGNKTFIQTFLSDIVSATSLR